MTISSISGNQMYHPETLLPFPSHGRVVLCIILMAVTIVGVSAILLATGGNIFAACAFLVGLVILTLTIYRVEWGFYLLFGAVLLCDQYEIPGFLSWTNELSYLQNLKETPFFPNIRAAVLNPMELHMALLLVVWFFVIVAKHERPANKIIAWPAAAAFFAGICGSFIYGMATKGDFLPALWEVRALFYLGFFLLFIPQIITRRHQVESLFWVMIVFVTVKAFQGAYRLIAAGFTFDGKETVTNHEDPLFILVLFIFLLALVLFNAKTKQISALMWLLFPLFIGFFAGQRRSVYAAIIPVFLCLFVLIPKQAKWRLLKTLGPILLAVILYMVVFWDASGRLASPARLVRSGLSLNREDAGEHYNSNLYREVEKFDLAITFRNAPVFGIGFGHMYEEPLWLVPIPFPLRDYIPHNEILWLLVKTGSVGFVLFWFFIDAVGLYGASVCNSLRDPYLKSVAVAIICAVLGQVVVSNFDLQLTFYRNMVFLGTLIGLLSALHGMDRRAEVREITDDENLLTQ